MNSALQCLSHTPGIVEYFTRLKLFIGDLNLDNALASKNNKIAIEFAKVINKMWNAKRENNNAFSPFTLKGAIGQENSMFKGY